ncbi:rRNA methyltransferase [Nocardia sp. CDC159]|uniref:rRNA methyltransferase n=1 Tax=Nocardia pulmonis TaxID=2951408 RepID=A0A9X2E4Q4_9NOCA|nr:MULTISPECIES: TrmH family RNA methyltransferase [Nocardia]MCM6774194.1 rRNA methyltransferase [Nocardia pulmonis]MCM6787081.1 rRNA methyltransferase [Nocardia sp. CDC159]
MTTRNAAVGEWQAYLTNRAKRHRDGRFLVHGRAALTAAVTHHWPLETLLYRLGPPELPEWARRLLDTSGAPSTGLVPELMTELSETDTGAPELVAVAKTRDPSLADFAPGAAGDRESPVVVVIEQPRSALRLGSVIRTAHGFGAAAVVISGAGADHYDPQCVRASDGSLFALPVFRVPGAGPVHDFCDRQAGRDIATWIVGVVPHHAGGQTRAVYEQDFRDATIVVIGDEAEDLGPAWREGCDELVSIPVAGAVAAPCAASIALYEIFRQRRTF